MFKAEQNSPLQSFNNGKIKFSMPTGNGILCRTKTVLKLFQESISSTLTPALVILYAGTTTINFIKNLSFLPVLSVR